MSSFMKFGVIADDYTGANDTGVQFVKKGLKTIVLTQMEKVRDIAGKGIADSRSMEEAVKIAVSIAESKFGKII